MVGGDVGSTLRVAVTASNGVGSTGAVSAATAVVVDSGPVTVTFGESASGDDGDIRVGGSSYPPSGVPSVSTAGGTLTTGRRFVPWGYEVFTSLLRFDTSAIPDGATVTSATLRVYVTGKQNADNRGFVGEWYDAANWPIDAADWSLSSSGSALAATPLSGIATSATDDFSLQNVASVSKTGLTGLRFHVDGGQPSGDNYVAVSSWDNTSLPKPQLVVTYTTGSSSPTAPSNTSPPLISGAAQVGQLLTASPGSWSGTAPIAYAYQWRRCDGAGAGCVDIVGATGSW